MSPDPRGLPSPVLFFLVSLITPWLYNRYFSVCFSLVSIPLESQLHEGRPLGLLCSLSDPWHLEQYVAHCKPPMDFDGMNGYCERGLMQAAGVVEIGNI